MTQAKKKEQKTKQRKQQPRININVINITYLQKNAIQNTHPEKENNFLLHCQKCRFTEYIQDKNELNAKHNP